MTSKLSERPSTRGGVPVFILPDSKPLASRVAVKPVEGLSPALPPPKFLSPIWISPFRKVPLVRMTVLEYIFKPSEVTTPVTL